MNGTLKVRTLCVPVLMGLALCTMSTAPLAAQNPAEVSADQFAALEWLEGRWVGTGGEAGTFYEEYRMLDDGTIEQITYSDASFSTPESRSKIQHMGGFVMKSGEDESQSIVTRIDRERVRFEWAGQANNGFTWNRVSDDEWYAVLDRADQAPVVYNMRRFSDL